MRGEGQDSPRRKGRTEVAAPREAVPRGELELIIRRAAELHLAESDGVEAITEAELIRIGAELGLTERHVRMAIYERPLAAEDRGADRLLGPAVVSIDRILEAEPPEVRGRLLHELTAREHLRFVKQDGPIAIFEPAPDVISGIARALRWPPGRAYLCRAPRVAAAARPLEPGVSHLHLELDFSDRRRRSFRRGVTIGALGGAGVAAAAGALAFEAAGAGAIPPGLSEPIAAALAGAASFAASLGAAIGLARRSFRERLAAAGTELDLFTQRIARAVTGGRTPMRPRPIAGAAYDPPPSPPS